MGQWENQTGATDEWYTPAYIFQALGERFDLDVAAPPQGGPHVPCDRWISESSLLLAWNGFVWMNPPFGGRNGIEPWLDRFFSHGNGIALMTDRTSAGWFQVAAKQSDAILFTAKKVRFHRPDGSLGVAPANGTAIMAAGERAKLALLRADAAGLGICMVRPE